ncbi:MAG: acyl carrier protein [Bacteroidales bacterium]|jgi:acyl carrier protein
MINNYNLPTYMTINDFINKIEDEYEDITPGTLKPDSIFRDVFEWNSINALILIALVKTEYDVTIDANDIQNSKTINDLFEIIKSRC